MERIIVASGYFDPIHRGHLEYLNKAKSLGGRLIVIVNNDFQARLKKGTSFMSQDERMEIVKNIRCVDEVYLSIDTDRGVSRSLEVINSQTPVDYFVNGGDVANYECREKDTCHRLNILMVDGLGEKIQSSSRLTGIKHK
jgi:cytidyltransferase-like protein